MFLRTNSSNADCINLVKQLDAELAEIDGDDNVFYAKLNNNLPIILNQPL